MKAIPKMVQHLARKAGDHGTQKPENEALSDEDSKRALFRDRYANTNREKEEHADPLDIK